jgi:hypothetical protein
MIATLVSRGISEAAATAEIDREIEEDFLNKGAGYHTVYPTLLTWSYGIVQK